MVLNLSKFLRFLLVGGLNTIVGFIIFSLTIYVTNGNVGLSLAANIGVGVFFNFLSYGYGVFRSLGVLRFVKFVCVYAILYTVNYLALAIMTGYGVNVYLAQFINLFYLAPISYLTFNRWVFD
jgi:putative flippase GtrA